MGNICLIEFVFYLFKKTALHYRSIVYCIKHSVVFYSNCATLVYIASIQVCAIFGDYIKKTVSQTHWYNI